MEGLRGRWERLAIVVVDKSLFSDPVLRRHRISAGSGTTLLYVISAVLYLLSRISICISPLRRTVLSKMLKHDRILTPERKGDKSIN